MSNFSPLVPSTAQPRQTYSYFLHIPYLTCYKVRSQPFLRKYFYVALFNKTQQHQSLHVQFIKIITNRKMRFGKLASTRNMIEFLQNIEKRFLSILIYIYTKTDDFNLKSYLNRDNKSQMDHKDSSNNYPTIKDFVLQEALEKAFEINVLGLKDFEKAKSEMLLERQDALHQELDKKHKEQLAAQRIHKSSLINRSRMQKMEMRHKNLLQIISKTQVHICQKIISNQSVYRKLLKDLIVEGLIKLLEPVVHIRCLRRDAGMVSGVLADAKVQFAALIQKEGMDSEVAKVELKVDDRYWLEQKKADTQQDAGRSKDHDMNKCFGGVILTNEEGLIVCKNTLDARIELAYQHMLPIIRSSLFN